eukprot:scaffold22742_cov139-Cylindrotheca_fusiformis.AAC.2
MAHLGMMLGKQIGSKVVSQSSPIVTQDLESVSFPSSASFILAQLYKGNDASQHDDDDRIWIAENSPGWKHQLKFSSESDTSSQWIIQSVQLSDDANEEKFCNGMPMVMAMGGFQWSLGRRGGDDDKPDCLNYFVPPWKLDSSGRFIGAMVYSFLLGIMTEGITNLHFWIRPHLGKGRLRKCVMPILYGAQQWLGYIVMMVTMMFSFELFLSVLVGLMVGRMLFLPKSLTRPIIPAAAVRTADANNTAVGGGETTPLLQGEHSSIRRRRR